MQKANKVRGLPQHLQWYEKILAPMKAAVAKLTRKILARKQEDAPVSYYILTAWILLNMSKQPTLEAQKPSSPSHHAWTMVHGFYSTMGGLAIRIPHDLLKSRSFSPSNSSETWFLTGKGIEFLLDAETHGHSELPDLAEQEIKAKSKANGLAKALVCMQAVWFIAQRLTRRMSHGIPCCAGQLGISKLIGTSL